MKENVSLALLKSFAIVQLKVLGYEYLLISMLKCGLIRVIAAY